MNDIKTKVCSICKRELPLTTQYFQHQKRNKDGWNCRCKECCGTNFLEKNKKWSDKEIKILHDNYPYHSNNELSEVFLTNRTPTQILAKAGDLGLKKDENYLLSKQTETGLLNLKNIGNQEGCNSPRWVERIDCKCEQCGKEILRTQYNLNTRNNIFCSIECMGKWMSENCNGENNRNYGMVWTNEMRLKGAENAVKNLKSLNKSYSFTKPQIIINELLNKLNIQYVSEFDCKYYLLDNYLNEYNLGIEVQGNFFHCNPVLNLNNTREKFIIRKDKSKNTYIAKYKGFKILYLWELDILNNIEKCEKLILEYITRYGELENYHSFNYDLQNSKLILNSELLSIGY